MRHPADDFPQHLKQGIGGLEAARRHIQAHGKIPAPVTLIRWERPVGDRSHSLPQFLRPATQQALWPAWAGVFSSMCGLPFMPTWFFVYLAALAALFSIAAYRALLAGIRSPTTLETHHNATFESV
jgi:hypothetical protein